MKRLAVLALLACSCRSAPPAGDWTDFYEHQPTSILVLPALNQTSAVEASTMFGSTITHPLVERGYYVYPVQATQALLESEGIYEGGQLEAIEPQKFHELLGADALLYVSLLAWDEHYSFGSSSVEVALDYRLVDARTGSTLWTNSQRQEAPMQNSGSFLSILLDPILLPGLGLNTFHKRMLLRKENVEALSTLPSGPLSKDFAEARKQLLARSKPAPKP